MDVTNSADQYRAAMYRSLLNDDPRSRGVVDLTAREATFISSRGWASPGPRAPPSRYSAANLRSGDPSS